MKVYAVVFSNYDPAEVGGLYEAREDAEREAEQRNAATDWSPWEVQEWTVSPPSSGKTPTAMAAAVDKLEGAMGG